MRELSLFSGAGGDYSAPNYWDGSIADMLNSTITASESSLNESKTASSTKPQSSAISDHSSVRGTPKAIREWLMSLPGDSHAKTSAQPTQPAKESTERKAGFGEKWPQSFALFDPNTFLWRTHQRSLLGDWAEYSETWPKWGLMLNGECWELRMLEPNTREKEYGYLPTPLASDADGGGIDRTKSTGKEYNLRDWWVRQGLGKRPRQRNPEFWEWVMGWPTGWTALKPLETVKFQSWLKLHGDY